MSNDLDELAIQNFREYLRIPSVHPDINYDDCVTFIENQAKSLTLPVRIYHCSPNKPILIVTWVGKEPDLPSIFLNGHMDVVPVFRDNWIHDPFGAVLDEDGNIYGRGSQDMKCLSIQYLEAIRRLKKDNVTLRRTVHISFVPDEEIAGTKGMKAFVKTKEFKALNIGFALDEGMASLDNVLPLFYAERSRWVLTIHCPGQPGHGSLLLENTAGEKARKILDRIYEFREQEKQELKNNPKLGPGDVTTVNLSIMKGGVQSNVIPPEFILVVDCRISITTDLEEFEKTLNKWCKEAGDGVWIEYDLKMPHAPGTNLDENNPFWVAFKQAVAERNIKLKPQILIAQSDSRYLREEGVPTIGFSPMVYTPTLMHDHNEYLNKDIFLRGIETYVRIITAVADAHCNNIKQK